ncbi:hypothetical protein [Streptomyces erythrochromogenes]|uniref:hypothetical protein n=1 Tax=Streptomyces erythrochromogenes TaxID=285574 RepID=UPI0036A4A0E2
MPDGTHARTTPGTAAHLVLRTARVRDAAGTVASAGPVPGLRMAAVFRDLHPPRLRHVAD